MMGAVPVATASQRDSGQADDRLVERFRTGDVDAFADLYARHYPRLVRFCLRRVHDPAAAEEVAQETFIRAFRALARLDAPRSFYPWLTCIARNLSNNYLRDGARARTIILAEPGSTASAEGVVLQRVAAEQLARAFGRLTDRHQQVLQLREREELTYDEIATAMGVAPTAVPPLLHRARLALRRECLAVAAGDRLLLLPGAGAVVAGKRRLQHWWAGNLPWRDALMVPVCVMAATASLALLPPTAPPVPATPARGVPQSLAPTTGPPRIATLPLTAASHVGLPASTESEAPAGHTVRVNDHMVSTNPERVDEGREWARRSPIRFELGPLFFGADPDGARRELEETTQLSPG